MRTLRPRGQKRPIHGETSSGGRAETVTRVRLLCRVTHSCPAGTRLGQSLPFGESGLASQPTRLQGSVVFSLGFIANDAHTWTSKRLSPASLLQQTDYQFRQRTVAVMYRSIKIPLWNESMSRKLTKDLEMASKEWSNSEAGNSEDVQQTWEGGTLVPAAWLRKLTRSHGTTGR